MDFPPPPRAPHGTLPDKSSELYIRDYPHRSIAIVTSTHALILRYSQAASESASNNSSHTNLPRARGGAADSIAAKCMVEFTPVSEKLLRDYRSLTPQPVYGTLGLMAVNNEVFLSVITNASRVASVRPGETIERIGSVAFYCLSSDNYDDVVPLDALEGDAGAPRSSYDPYSDTRSVSDQMGPYGQGLGRREVAMEHPCHELRNLLSNGTFYYSTDFDLTNRVQDRYEHLRSHLLYRD